MWGLLERERCLRRLLEKCNGSGQCVGMKEKSESAYEGKEIEERRRWKRWCC